MIPALALFGLWCLGFLFLFRIPACRAADPGRPLPSFAIIVPARNEERNLPVLLGSIARQDAAPAEVIVVDDGSTDQTARVAAEHKARVLAPEPAPPGWRGKNWACYQGARAASAELLIFADADTRFEDGGLRRILNAYLDGEGVLSIGAYHRVERPYEELSAFFNLIMTASTGAFTVFGEKRRPNGLFGPFLMLDRNTYFSMGGHERVRDKILENFHLGAVFRGGGVRTRCLGGRGAFTMRMYPDGLESLVAGWSKAFADGAAQTPPLLLLLITAWLSGGMASALMLVWALFHTHAPAFAPAMLTYLLFAAQIHWMLRRIGSFRAATAWLYPIPMVFYFCVFTRSALLSALGRPVSWKGRRTGAAPPEEGG